MTESAIYRALGIIVIVKNWFPVCAGLFGGVVLIGVFVWAARGDTDLQWTTQHMNEWIQDQQANCRAQGGSGAYLKQEKTFNCWTRRPITFRVEAIKDGFSTSKETLIYSVRYERPARRG